MYEDKKTLRGRSSSINQSLNSKRILFSIGHPAQFHLFKFAIKELRDYHKIAVVITEKELLKELCVLEEIKYEMIIPRSRKRDKFNLFINLLKTYWLNLKFAIKFKPDLLIGTDITLPLIGKLINVDSLVFNEDDFFIVPEIYKLSYPFASFIVSPFCCQLGKWEKKRIGYQGYQKLAYLHPQVINFEEFEKQRIIKEKYVLIRFSKLNAYHDKNNTGINNKIAEELLSIIKTKYRVYISSERELPEGLKKYKLNTGILDIYNVLYNAEMLISDSQSMTIEAALLGTPSIRLSDFSNKISVLNELEYQYNLTYGFSTNESDKMITKLMELIELDDLKGEWKKRREKLLEDKINVKSFICWLVDKYPDSISEIRENPSIINSIK